MNELTAKLLWAIMMVESGGNCAAVGDNGAAIGPYQIHQEYWTDATRHMRVNWRYEDARDRNKSRRVVVDYLTQYGRRYKRITGREPTAEILCRIHNGGPDGWRRPATKDYWKKVERRLRTQEIRRGKK